MAYPFIIKADTITVVVDNRVHNVNSSHLNFFKIREAIRTSKWDQVKELVDVSKSLATYASGSVSIVDNAVLFNGQPIEDAISNKMLQMYREGFDIKPLSKFVANLAKNPSKRAVDELYGFLEVGNLPITTDGKFIAFKRVRDNYTDVHTGTMSNKVGKIVQMDRNKVDDNKDRTCSAGLHFCSLDYLNNFSGERVMILLIDPADVVSIPTDYNFTKGRCCKYRVIGEITGTDPAKVLETAVYDYNETTGEVKTANKLSMTPGAIRKRAQRARIRAQKEAADKALASIAATKKAAKKVATPAKKAATKKAAAPMGLQRLKTTLTTNSRKR